MLAALGLQHATTDILLTIAVFAAVASLVHGWAVDSVLGDAGFGVIGNTILSLFGGTVGIWTWAVFLRQQPLMGHDLANVIMFGVAGAMLLLIALAFVRRALARD